MKTKIQAYCPECHVSIGMPHLDGCDIAQCYNCGGQRLTCQCKEPGNDTWTGYWPGTKEAEEYGFFYKDDPTGNQLGLVPPRITCDGNDPDARVNITAMQRACLWDKDKKRFVKPA